MLRWLPILLLVTACGGGEPTGPSPITAPAPMPAPLVTPDPLRFDATFNAQLVHDAFDHPDARQPARLLRVNPSIYLQTDGLSAALVADLEQAGRDVVPAMSGGMRQVVTFETGSTARPEAAGWIVVDLVADDTANCGRSLIGAAAGHIWLNTVARCRRNGAIIGSPNLFAHELGHALGFWHVADPGAMMNAISTRGLPTDAERYHAGLAYQSNGAYSARIR